jgi:myo-inositol-hexaphosphate 3-phosphohydrolase
MVVPANPGSVLKFYGAAVVAQYQLNHDLYGYVRHQHLRQIQLPSGSKLTNSIRSQTGPLRWYQEDVSAYRYLLPQRSHTLTNARRENPTVKELPVTVTIPTSRPWRLPRPS